MFGAGDANFPGVVQTSDSLANSPPQLLQLIRQKPDYGAHF